MDKLTFNTQNTRCVCGEAVWTLCSCAFLYTQLKIRVLLSFRSPILAYPVTGTGSKGLGFS